MRSLRLNKSQASNIFRCRVFNIVARNHDDHSKNVDFILNKDHHWELAAAFAKQTQQIIGKFFEVASNGARYNVEAGISPALSAEIQNVHVLKM